ncbi:MAG: hypothetical protein ABUS51_07320, partial [Acidobacteriota bacterium]
MTCLAATFAITLNAFGGTVSPQLNSMDPSHPVEVIIQHSSSLVGTLLSTVCGVTNLLELLPGGELCSTTVAGALSMMKNPMVGHISVSNTLQGTGSVVPVYDYTPQSLQPSSASSGSANPSAGRNIGVAIIDSGIHVNQDLTGNGSGGLLSGLFPQVVYAESFVPGEGIDD